MDLIKKRTRLLEIKKEIAWISSEFTKMRYQWENQEGYYTSLEDSRLGTCEYISESRPTFEEKNQITIWYDYLRELIKELNDMNGALYDMNEALSDDYKILVRTLQSDLARNSKEDYCKNNQKVKL